MGTYKTNWQLTETVMPEDMNRIEENTRENNNALSEFKKQYNADSKEENKKIERKAEKEDVILKVHYPEDRDCNSFKTLNAFCTFDTGAGDFKNTPEGNLAYGTAKVFMIINKGYSSGRFQQEFIFLYPQDHITRYIRNFNSDNENPWGTWWKAYDEANKPTADELGVLPVKINMDNQDLNNLKKPGQYYGSTGMSNAPEQGESLLEVILYNNDCLVQRFTRIKSSHKHITYTRGFINSVWSSWVKIYDENNKPTPADIGAINQTPTRVTSLNNLTNPGFYVVDSSEGPTKYGRLLVLGWDNSQKWVTQVFFSDTTNKVYSRCITDLVGPKWSGWSQIYSTEYKPTPQDVGAINKQGDTMLGNLIMSPERVFVGAHNFGYKCDTKEGTSAYVLYIDNDNKVHLGHGGRPIKIDAVDIVNQNNKKIYHEDNKPNPDDIGAIPNTGGRLTGNLEFAGCTSPIKITGFQGANGLDYHKNNGDRMGSIGMLGNSTQGELTRAYMGITPTPWDGNKSLTVGLEGVYFDNQKIYYPGNKPSPQDIGAASTSHNHDSAYLGKTDTAANSNKLKNWDIAGASNDYAGIPVISHDGVMELGPILDFHLKGSKKDFDMRITTREGALEIDKALSAENLWARKYLRINDWYGGAEDGRLWYKQENKKLYTENIEDLVVNNRSIAKGDYWDNDNGNVRVCHLGGGLRLVRQIIKTGYANSGGGVSYTIHFPKAWNWVLPISLISHNYGDASNNTSGYCTIDTWSNTYLNGGCYQMVAGKPTQIILTYIATE